MKVTSKYQVTLPKSIADQYGIRPGDDIQWIAAGDVIRVLPPDKSEKEDLISRLRLFDQASQRQGRRAPAGSTEPRARGWTREGLYRRGRSR